MAGEPRKDDVPPAVQEAFRAVWDYVEEQRRAAYQRREAASREVTACNKALRQLGEVLDIGR